MYLRLYHMTLYIMKKVIFSNIPILVILGYILYQIDYNNLQTLDYIFIVLCILAFVMMVFNLVTTYIKEKQEKKNV
ncbi:hypothetical protein [Bacillus thuringiensis]|uniref:Uncharacterized protein n=4 Tax=Bacillus thuringiensis TaxID=1428 RepID=A0A1W6WYT1_BACTU|nr:hypothetical protein [Bacillus thuringiensis]EJR61973.1 hypothetical protein IIO_02881 [Bacillus cereus VD115]ERH97484.1 hypothetical protein BTCBT_006329 [Bacillus thuringiensis T01-328]MEC3286373.1 hypothetical protein [Bacillus cereus]OTW38697.1 hypothetical protein BK698_25475 [Bacillus thuringiensis serovar thuringiensis]ARP61720.1 hypothetical protein CAB88_32465 [Bacillus thuringiensis]